MATKRGRAQPMTPVARREALIEATIPLLYQHGRAVSTRLIAEAAGVAEGTIFRAFDTKDALIEASLVRAWDPWPFLARIAEIDPALPFRERCLQLVTLLQQRFLKVFALMSAVGMIAPPEEIESAHGQQWRTRATELTEAVVGPDADLLRIPVREFVHLVRLLTFSASHHQISDGHVLTPEQIVDTLLFGTLSEKGNTTC